MVWLRTDKGRKLSKPLIVRRELSAADVQTEKLYLASAGSARKSGAAILVCSVAMFGMGGAPAELTLRHVAVGRKNWLFGKSRCVRQAMDSRVCWTSGQVRPLGIYLQAEQV